MPKPYTHSFLRGLETTGLEDGTELPAWSVFQNVRLDQNAAKRRAGMQRIATCSNPNSALTFNGTTQGVYFPSHAAFNLGRYWTVKGMFKPADTTGTQDICGFLHATNWPFRVYMDTSTLKAKVGLTGGTVTLTGGTVTASATNTFMLTRRVDPDDSSQYELSLWTNGVQNTPTTAALDTTIAPAVNFQVAYSNDTNYFAGDIDHICILSVCLTTAEWARMRIPNPKMPFVVFDAPMQVADASTKRVDDRSRHRNHGTAKGVPSSATTLAVQTAPVTLLAQRLDYAGEQRLDICAGGKFYLAGLK